MELEELYALMERFARSGLTDLEWEREGEKIALRCAPAPADCVVEEVLARDGEAVGFGEPLLRIRRV